MPKYNDFKKIVDDCLSNKQMTESQKNSVIRKIRNIKQPEKKSNKKYYVWVTSAVAACLAVVLLVTQVLPIGNDVSFVKNSDSSVSTSSTSNNSNKIENLLMDASPMNITATNQLKNGIKIDTSFLISTDGKNISAETMAERLSITPKVDFTVTKQEDGTFLLETEADFDENSIVNVSYKNEADEIRTWAFQTESSLTVRSTLPGNNTGGMPLNTGIEMYFSGNVQNIKDHFVISPETNGKFIYENNSAIFVPNKDLEEDTVYTVTIKAGLKDSLGSELKEDYTFSFRTPESDYAVEKPRFYNVDNFTESYLPDDIVSLTIWGDEYFENRDLNIRLYKLSGADEYLSIAKEYNENINPYIGRANDYEIDVSDLTLEKEFKTQLQLGSYSWYEAYIIFPETPDIGYYLADIRIADADGATEDLFIQKLIQISDLSVYASTLNGSGVVWVNDTVTGNTVSNADVTLICGDTSSSSVTDENGAAKIDVPAIDYDETAYIMVETSEKDIFVDSLSVSGDKESDYSNRFYSFVYTDREAYLPTDTINFWGKLIPKSGEYQLPETLDIYLGNSKTIAAQVNVSESGSFEGSVDIENHTSYGDHLYFRYNGANVYSEYFSVIEYEKPTYILELSSDKTYYKRDEPINITINGSFYSGEPASGLEVEAYVNVNNAFVLDENGEAKFSFVPNRNQSSWFGKSAYIGATTSGTENVWVNAHHYVPYFESDYMLNYEKLNDNGTVLKINTNEIDFAKVDETTINYTKDKFIDTAKGAPAELSGRIEITRCEYVQHQEGTRYNFITKRNEPVYYYDYVETVWANHEFTTENGEYITPEFDLDYSNSCWYTAYIYYTTPDGVSLRESVYFGNDRYYPYYMGNPYSFVNTAEESPRVGDAVNVELRYKAQNISSGKMIVNISQSDILETTVLDSLKHSFEFTENYRSGINVSGAYFDGKHIYDASGIHVNYDSTEKALNISIDTDKDDYSPGETVQAEIKITDENNEPIEADFVLSTVDDAAFAIMEQYSDPLTMMYNSSYYSMPTTYASFVPRFEEGAYAEGGGDGVGEGVRSDFKDNAAFISGRTNKNGTGYTEFTLPDNLTSWRLTVSAISDDGYAGIIKRSVTSSIPYFINVVYSDDYISGDDVVISAKPYGSDIETEYTVTVECGDYNDIKNFTGISNKFTYMDLGKLGTGVYTLTVEAVSGEMRDAVEYTFNVVESKHELPIIESFDMASGIEISSLRYPVKLMVYDKQNNLYMKAVSRMMSSGNRFDQKAANYVAESILYDVSNAELVSYQTYENGISLFSYGDADAVTTAKALISVPEKINAEGAVKYLYSVLYNSESAPIDVAAAYMGLASQMEPVLFDVKLLLNTDDLSLEEELYLAAALALLGDQTGASEWFKDNYRKIESEKDFDTQFRLKSQAILLAELINHEETMKLLDYIISNYSTKYLPSLDLAAYIRYTDIPAESDAVFTGVINGKTETFDFKNSKLHVFTMSEDELKASDFKVVKGDIGVTASYVGSSDNIEDTSNGKINVSTSYELRDTDSMKVGSLIAVSHIVTIDSSIESEHMAMSVSIPSGARFVKAYNPYNSGWSFCGEENGRVYVTLNGGRSSYTIQYYIRLVFPGEFVFEPVILTSNESGLRYIGERKVITSK